MIDAPWEGGANLLTTALWLVADNAQAGRINGRRLAEVAPYQASRHLCSATCARHCISVGARVYLNLNSIWDVNTVPLGLMNGARGGSGGVSLPPTALPQN